MKETSVVRPPTVANMRLDGGHPALDLVNTVYGQVDGPVEADVLAAPEDLVTFARRVGLADQTTPASPTALRSAVALRDALDAVLRARLAGEGPPAGPCAEVEAAARAALAAARLAPHGDALAWTWPSGDPRTPVHRLAQATVQLLTSDADLAALHCCAGCRWLFLDRSRGAGRRWCSMADCGTEAKKRRYVQRRRQRRQAAPAAQRLGRAAHEGGGRLQPPSRSRQPIALVRQRNGCRMGHDGRGPVKPIKTVIPTP